MDVFVEKERCTGCQHCRDVCPVAVYEMRGRGTKENPNADGANADTAPAGHQWTGKVDQDDFAKWSQVQDGHMHFAQ